MNKSSRLNGLVQRTSYSYPAWALLVVLLIVCAIRAPYLFSANGIGGLLVSAGPLVLAVMGLTVTAMVGSGVDLSAGPLLIFVNVTLVRLFFENQIGSPVVVFAWALGIGILVQVIQAVVITVARIEPVIVTLSAFLALSGINLVILSQPGGQAPRWLAEWGSGRSVLSPMALVVLVSVVAWLLFTRTRLFTNVRLVGSNQRTAFVSGIPVTATRVIAHAVSGLLIGAAGLAYTGQIGSGNPTQGATYTLAAITALILGGISLAGGRGGLLGSIPGALVVTLISFTLTTFSLGSLASYVVQLSYGLILVLALLLSVAIPVLWRRRQEVRGA
ncbi:ABC transporter permease [Arthrobacter sp. K5]|uniref:Autoinducer 2 import system permease protein LsrD n=1 Tax=Arthrobacter sp. K5 TaxID=2839623 RepID=A0AAU8EX72_9MICC